MFRTAAFVKFGAFLKTDQQLLGLLRSVVLSVSAEVTHDFSLMSVRLSLWQRLRLCEILGRIGAEKSAGGMPGGRRPWLETHSLECCHPKSVSVLLVVAKGAIYSAVHTGVNLR